MKVDLTNNTNLPLHVRPDESTIAPGATASVSGLGAAVFPESLTGSVKATVTNDGEQAIAVSIDGAPGVIIQPTGTHDFESRPSEGRLELNGSERADLTVAPPAP